MIVPDTDDKGLSGPTDKDEDEIGTEEKQSVSVRDSIRAAIVEHSDDEIVDDKKEDKEPKEIKEPREPKESKEDKSPREDDKQLKLDLAKKEVKEDKKEVKSTFTAPKEIEPDWNHVPESAKGYIDKVQKDLAAATAKSASYKELDGVLAQYEPSIKQLGVTPAQTVERLFQWMTALSGPNKYDVIHQLAGNFGIDLDAMYAEAFEQATKGQQANPQQQQQQAQQAAQVAPAANPDLDPRLAEAIYGMYTELDGLKAAEQKRKQDSAAMTVDMWAGKKPDGTFEKKPHFAEVKQIMHSLLASGAIPLINGNLDLDTAYDQACYTVPKVRAEILAQQDRDKQTKLREEAKRKLNENKTKVAKAKSLNLSIRPSSPATNIAAPNNSGNKRENNSIRNSIYNAIREVTN